MKPQAMATARLGAYSVLALSALIVMALAGASLSLANTGYVTSDGDTYIHFTSLYKGSCGAIVAWGLLFCIFSIAAVITGFFANTSIFAWPLLDIVALSIFLVLGLGSTGAASAMTWDVVYKPGVFAGMQGIGWLLVLMCLAWLVFTIVVTIKLGKQWRRSWASQARDTTPGAYMLDKPTVQSQSVHVPLMSQQQQPVPQNSYPLSADPTGHSISTSGPYGNTNPQYQQQQYQQPQYQQPQYETPQLQYQAAPIQAQVPQQPAVQHQLYTQPFTQAQPSTYQPQEQTYIVQPATSSGFTTVTSKV